MKEKIAQHEAHLERQRGQYRDLVELLSRMTEAEALHYLAQNHFLGVGSDGYGYMSRVVYGWPQVSHAFVVRESRGVARSRASEERLVRNRAEREEVREREQAQ